jgi:DtxR family transcriptional regulator, Mn-dependent transcriptional regulator
MESNIILSESEEMYLVTIARLVENGVEMPVPISLLAHEMEITAISANQMVRKLEECELVRYYPYKGVSLTEVGEIAAQRVLRHRRLWEVFLVEHLKFNPAEAEHLACRVEHVFPDEAAERLADYLGQPNASPQGKPIPDSGGPAGLRGDISLSQLSAGQSGRVRQVTASPETRAFLANLGISTGENVTVLAATRNGEMLLAAAHGSVHLAAGLVDTIKVQGARIDHLPGSPTS